MPIIKIKIRFRLIFFKSLLKLPFERKEPRVNAPKFVFLSLNEKKKKISAGYGAESVKKDFQAWAENK